MAAPSLSVLPHHHKGKTPVVFLWSWLRARISKKCKLSCWFALMVSIAVIGLVVHRVVARTLTTKAWEAAPINNIERQCPAVSYPTIKVVSTSTTSTGSTSSTGSSKMDSKTPTPKICMTTLTDQQQADWLQRLVKWRQFDNLLTMTWPNKKAYCERHGYYLVDSSPYLDNTRPPSWSKIIAVRRLLVQEKDKCDWVVWLDADTVIMNPSKKFEDLLPANHDFVVTKQKLISYNAGAWIIKNTPWSLQFLDHWWNMDEFVRVKGLSVSGDNDALFHYLTERMPADEFAQHVVVPPRCSFNSVTKWVPPGRGELYQANPELVKREEWYMHEEYYHKGDLIAHVAGRNNKIDTTKELLRHAPL